jgi:hypothetical protein
LENKGKTSHTINNVDSAYRSCNLFHCGNSKTQLEWFGWQLREKQDPDTELHLSFIGYVLEYVVNSKYIEEIMVPYHTFNAARWPISRLRNSKVAL